MISPSEALSQLLSQSTTLESRPACHMEYNMNSLIDGVTVVSSSTAADYISGITDWGTTKSNPFKLLFPVDSIIKSFRPEYPGAKYFIMGGPNVKDTYSSDASNPPFLPFRTLKYTGEGKNFNVQGAKPRLYYPGVDTEYKYWLSPLNKNIDLTVQYLQTTTTWANAGKTGSIPTGNKAALANKIIIKFEKFHSIPTNYKVTITKNDNTTSVVGPLTTTSSESGLISLTLEGGTWTKRDYASGPSPFLPIDNPILIKSIRLEATNPGGGKYLGVIEISARWVTNITSDIVEMQINKESSSSTENILPVGLVTANTMTASLNRFNQSALKIKTYDRDSELFETDVIYLTKNAEMRSYFDVIHPAGATTQSGLTFDRIQQGTFFIDSWSISQYGESSVTALDGSKYLMETLCPDLLCQNAPVVSILRNLLDAIGFTNYNFNIISGVNTEDKSIPNVNYWWTEDTSTVWDEIQSLCRDIQMNAVFDENNILQFYSRDYLYSQTNSTQNFYQKQNGSNLPNIVSFNKKEIASANSVKVIWKSPLSSNYLGNSDYLWESNESFLSAGALKSPTIDGVVREGPAITLTDEFFVIDNTSLDPYSQQQSFYNYSGFVLIDSEIIEYEALGYTYQPIDMTLSPKQVWIFSGSDVNKYLSLSAPGFQDPKKPETAYFKPDGRYKIKKRGALGTTAAVHEEPNDKINNRDIWNGAIISYGGKQSVSVGNNGNNSSYNFKTQIRIVEQPTANSLVIDSKTDAPYLKYDIQELSETNANVGQLVTGQISLGSSRDNLFTIGPSGSDLNQSLKSGVKYRITLTPQNQAATQRGNSQTIVYRVIKNQFNGSLTSNPSDPTLISSITKSFFKLGSSNLNSQQCAIAFRPFDSIKIPPSTSVSSSYPPNFFGDYFQSYAGPTTIPITAASAASGKITYTAAGHKFPVNDVIEITGISIPSYNKSVAVITDITANTFSVSGTVETGTPTFNGASASSGSYYYSFGTTMFLDKSSVNPSQSGGIGFFVNDLGTTGYFIIIETLKSAAPANRKSVRIVKATQDGIKNLIDSQVTLPNTLDGIYGGLAYNIDVKVKLSGQRLEIKTMINGFSVNAVDINSSDLVKDDNWIFSPTKNVGLISIQGTMMFDYVYGMSIKKDNFDSSAYVPNLYQAQFSNDLLSTAYGDLIYNTNVTSEEESKKLESSVDEFGSVVREIAYVKQKFDSRPSFPITWTIGANKFASIIGSKLSSFGAEAYILNNASVRIPLSDGGANTLSIIGNQLGDSGELVYSTDDTSDYSAKEPLVFKSSWIQNEQDAKNLAEWIKAKVINKGRIVNMSVFGNPLISVGEIVSIYNDYQLFFGTEKLIVTEVSHTFSQGLETSVTCRTL
jgi:hypothetical protein